MVDDIKLYINDRLVEFTADPNVLYTYQTTDMSNPTAVKNSFSKTIQLDGTPANNDIFGQYWDVERFVDNGSHGGTVSYNGSKKAPFQLFVGSDLYEEGYCKLDNIQKEGASIKYNISLYGGLGDYFWSLSTSTDGKEKKLSDLIYTEGGGNDEFDFTANIDTVKEAWDALANGTSGKWQYINFAPAYNGKPSDFNANKVVMNLSGTSLQKTVKNSDDEKWYSTRSGWTVGTLPDDMTEWEIRDLRSYLQRPAIKMSSIVEACCNPINNGGYEVDLDPDFFNQDNEYWTKTWVTLPMVQNLEYSNEEQILEGAELIVGNVTGDSAGLMYENLRFDLGEIQNASSITLKGRVLSSIALPYTSYIWFWNWNGDSVHPSWVFYGSLFVQLIALNGDTVVGASEVYNLTSPIRHNGNLYYGNNSRYPDSTGTDPQTGRRKMGDGSKYVPYMDQPIYDVLGILDTNGFKREISHTSSGSTFSSTPYEFAFHINNIGSEITGLKLVYYWGSNDTRRKHYRSDSSFNRPYSNGWIADDGFSYSNVTADRLSFQVTDHNINAVMGESLGRTGTKVTKQLLLNTESSPCDYLLSYCKMFGLHFLKDIGEKRIHIMTRKTFYDRNDVVDLNEYIDRSRPSEITPIMFKSKWYQFHQEMDETELQQKYLTTKGVEYGCKILDTGYEFNADKIDLLKDNCLRSGIECVEKSKYFTAYNNDSVLRPWMNLGLKYTLWNDQDTFEYNAGIGNTGTILPINEGQGLKYYDIFPKLQFHGDGNSPTDGNNCLVFFSGFKSVTTGRSNPLTYILSDDTVYQTDLNDGTPCWLFTPTEVVNNKRLCYKLDRIPVFERYLTSQDSGTVQKSLDFGSAQELYVPSYNLTDETNVYHNFWRTYLEDLFDTNTRQMTCYIRVIGKPNPEWFRRFYWFDNAVWVLNKLADWNVTSQATSKAEFVKVQDLHNYTSVSQTRTGIIELEASTYSVDATGQTITLYVTTDAGVSWRLNAEGGSTVTLSSTAGTGTSTVTATFGPNNEDYQVGTYITATRNDNAYSTRIYIHQVNVGYKFVQAVPGDIIVPASGGEVIIDFIWTNQGDSYIYEADWKKEADGGWDFDVDHTTLRDENKAILTFYPWTGDTVRHNYCTFCDFYHDVCTSIGIDQLPEEYAFSNTGSSQVMITEYAEGATFNNLPYWAQVTPSGTDYTIAAEQNPTTSARTQTARMELNGTYADFVITQEPASEELIGLFQVARINGSDDVPSSGGSIVLEVTSPDKAWTASTSDGFITLGSTGATGSTTFSVQFASNSSSTSRYCVINFVDALGNTVTYSQTQAAYVAPPEPPEPPAETNALVVMRINGSDLIPASGGTAVLQVSTQGQAWTASTSDGFITLNPTGNTTSGNMTVTFSANTGDSRYCSVDFVDALGNELTWTQTQEAYVEPPQPVTADSVTPAYLLFSASGGTAETQDITVQMSDDWKIVGYPAWVTFSPASGTSGTTTVSVTAIPYSGDVQRQGSLVVVNLATGEPYIVTCIQNPGEGEILAVSPSSLRYNYRGGEARLTIIANTDWTIG